MSSGVRTPTQQLADWLSSFGNALEHGDIASATAMFDQECYWRDLVAFTWNLKTLESQDEISRMLQARSAAADEPKPARVRRALR